MVSMSLFLKRKYNKKNNSREYGKVYRNHQQVFLATLSGFSNFPDFLWIWDSGFG